MAIPKLCKRRALPFGVMGYANWSPEFRPNEGSPRYFRVENYVIDKNLESHRHGTSPFAILIISDSLNLKEKDLVMRVAPINDDGWFDEHCLYFEEE